MSENPVPTLDLDALADDTGDGDDGPSCTFRLAGQEWACRHADDIPFDVVSRLFGSQSEQQALVMVEPFFKAVLYRDQVDDFLALLHDEDSPITLRTIQPLIEHLATNVLGRPTRRPAPSRRGPLPKTPTSTAV